MDINFSSNKFKIAQKTIVEWRMTSVYKIYLAVIYKSVIIKSQAMEWVTATLLQPNLMSLHCQTTLLIVVVSILKSNKVTHRLLASNTNLYQTIVFFSLPHITLLRTIPSKRSVDNDMGVCYCILSSCYTDLFLVLMQCAVMQSFACHWYCLIAARMCTYSCSFR